MSSVTRRAIQIRVASLLVMPPLTKKDAKYSKTSTFGPKTSFHVLKHYSINLFKMSVLIDTIRYTLKSAFSIGSNTG